MYLEKLEIQGFKSFAVKNRLVFPGMLDASKRGITAIVGPNGSGKSNVADAVRWALGEQSMKTLRGKKSEDVIFSGSDKKGKLGMSEVSLFLNNEDRQAPIDYSEIVITRRLFRNGDSEYMINNSRARLSDIQMMLAKAKFGQKTYSVIGQGLVESFLNTSLAERKEFFDEATGVKQYQIKRDDSLNKLCSSYENLIQAQMLISEIEPRLKSLTRQVGKLQKRGELEAELKQLQLAYYSGIWHEINDKFNKFNQEFLELEQTKLAKDKKLEFLNREMDNLKNDNSKENKTSLWQNELIEAQARKEEINRKLARLEAQIEVKLEANGQFDAAYLFDRQKELINEKKILVEEIGNIEDNIKQDKKYGEELDIKHKGINKKIETINAELEKIAENNDQLDSNELNKQLADLLKQVRQANEESDIGKIKIFIANIKDGLKQLLNLTGEHARNKQAEKIEEGQQELYQQLKELIKAKEEISIKINDNKLRITARSERVKLLKEKQAEIEQQSRAVSEKLNITKNGFSPEGTGKEQEHLNGELKMVEEKISGIQEKISQANAREKTERDKLFALQHDIQNLQNEINLASNQLNDIKINSTRYETKLEDLEIEIREELGGLKEIRENKKFEESDVEGRKNKINQLKRQLELIGGIDPRIEEEFKETKERFDFLFGQVSDLTKAVESLEKVIKELDTTIKERFDREFKLIEKNFEKYFKILFNGGQAKIIKVMDDSEEMKTEEENEDSREEKKGRQQAIEIADIKKIKFLQKHNATGLAGIEIQATPPGKKIKSISMLSGGERALTAIALICAIINANPSPFVVLDEVDAALDEANSERLAKILDELSHRTQFIIITHNRASMRRANILYGVTMGDDGVSKLLSIKLDDAKAVVK
ncbi:MAG: AAA family ATPase [Patescibacteria group bacterium]|nr:AAA family ATPase [Patescibacteria group bacterium]